MQMYPNIFIFIIRKMDGKATTPAAKVEEDQLEEESCKKCGLCFLSTTSITWTIMHMLWRGSVNKLHSVLLECYR